MEWRRRKVPDLPALQPPPQLHRIYAIGYIASTERGHPMRLCVYAFTLLAAVCIPGCKSTTGPVSGLDAGTPAITEQSPVVIGDQPASAPQENGAPVFTEQAVAPSSGSGGIPRCLSDLAGYQGWLALAQLSGGQVEQTCESLRVRDGQGRPIIDIRLDNCELRARYTVGFAEVDTTINVCE
jgi:hypothetical protein